MRAIQQRWPIKPEDREAIVKRLTEITKDDNASRRERISAAKALMFAEAQNQTDEQQQEGTTVHHEHDHVVRVDAGRSRLLAIADRCGVGGMVKRVADQRTSVIDGRVIGSTTGNEFAGIDGTSHSSEQGRVGD